jgi:hypothetical protein
MKLTPRNSLRREFISEFFPAKIFSRQTRMNTGERETTRESAGKYQGNPSSNRFSFFLFRLRSRTTLVL